LWAGNRKGIWPVKTECWFVDGGDLTRASHVLEPHGGSWVVRIDLL